MLFLLLGLLVSVDSASIKHVVTVMLENQSLVRLFGTMRGLVGAVSPSNCNPTGNGTDVCMKFGPPLVQVRIFFCFFLFFFFFFAHHQTSTIKIYVWLGVLLSGKYF
jgi:phospholipase C